MKISFSLSDDVARRLEVCARSVAGGNASILTDVALKRLLDLPPDELTQLVARHRMDRKAATRHGWAEAFWLVLGEEMGRRDMIDNPYAARNYGDFYVVLLLSHIDGHEDEGDSFHPYLGPRMYTPQSPPPQQWTFDRSESPVRVAETVAAKLRELGVEQESRI